MSEVAIRLEGVSKYYKLYDSPRDRLKEALHPGGKKYHRDFYALHDIDLEIRKGEILGVVGMNGSGKSTLLKLVSGVLRQNSGSLHVQGKVSALLELGAGFNPEFTGLQNIYFYATVLGIDRREIEQRIGEIVAFADIGDFIGQPLKTYSSGMKSRLGFAMAIHVDPDILILDEVLAVGDVLFRRKCYAKMEEFFSSGKTVIYVSHSSNSINQVCSRAIFLDRGRILLDGQPKQVTSWYQKYMFTKDEGRRKIESELLGLSGNAGKKQHEKAKVVRSGSGAVHQGKRDMRKTDDYLLSEFVPVSTVWIRNHDVGISDPCISTLDGRKVNVLKTGEKYIFSFSVRFGTDASGVSFGSQIKTDRGVTVSLASLQESGDVISHIGKGEYHVEWAFDCQLLTGNYFMDSSVTGFIGEKKEVLCRAIDIYGFKVAPARKSLYGGIVSLNQRISVRRK